MSYISRERNRRSAGMY